MLFRETDHYCKLEMKRALIQTPVAHLPKYFGIEKFGYLKQLFVGDRLGSLLIVLKISSTPYAFSLKIEPSNQTFSTALEISRNIPLTSVGGLQSILL